MRRSVALLVVALAASSACSKDASSTSSAPPPSTAAPGARRIEITVTEKGYEPSPISVERGQPVELVITRKTEMTCATDIVIKEHGIKKELPLGQPVSITFTPEKSGELRYGCSMEQMISGVLMVK